MATLPTDADTTPNYTAANHATHHNTIHGLWNVLTTAGDILYATGAQAYARLAKGTAGQVLTMNAGATAPEWATPSGTTVVPSTYTTRTAGSLTLNSTSWANVPSVSQLTLTGVAVGDIIEVGLSAVWDVQAVEAVLDVATWVSSAAVNAISGAGGASGQGIVAWRSAYVTTNIGVVGGGYLYTLVSGDISGGNVVLQLRYRTLTAANKTLYASTDLPLHFYAKNLRH